MKKVLLLFFSFFIFITIANAEDYISSKKEVSLINVKASNDISLELDGKIINVSLIAFDKSDGTLNKEINNYIVEKLKNANKIEIENDLNSNKYDKYNRMLVWLYVDDVLLQKDLIEKGYGQVNYISGNYNYLTELCSVQANAIKSSLGIWNYPDIKEEYCNSGIKSKNKKTNIEENQKTNTIDLYKNLKYIIFLNSGILILLIILRGKKW